MSSTPFFPSRPHPWHGPEPGPAPPSMIYAQVEITPHHLVKHGVDKTTRYLLVDHPQ